MVLAALVVLLFLRDWRATADHRGRHAAVADPDLRGDGGCSASSLNIVTLLALTLVIGILVDDAIVEIENIEKRVRAGPAALSRRPWRAPTPSAWRWSPPPLAIVVVFTPVVVHARHGRPVLQGVRPDRLGGGAVLAAGRAPADAAAGRLLPEAQPPSRKPRQAAAGASTSNALDWALDHVDRRPRSAALSCSSSRCVAGRRCCPRASSRPSDPGYCLPQHPGPARRHAAPTWSARSQQTTPDAAGQARRRDVFARSARRPTAFGGGGGDLRDGTITVILKEHRTMTTDEFKQSIRDDLRGIPDARVVTAGGFGAARTSR